MSWSSLQQRVEELDATPEQQAKVAALISSLGSIAPPTEVTKNAYDGAISLHWQGYEVAAYDHHLETYQFHDGDTIIHHWPHEPGAPLPNKLVEETTEAVG